jgi:chromosome segregation ATPase
MRSLEKLMGELLKLNNYDVLLYHIAGYLPYCQEECDGLYFSVMDERKKTIKDLETRKKANLASVDALLIQVGEVLLPRIQNEVPEYGLLARDIHDSEESIAAARADIARLKKLDEDIRGKEQESSELNKTIFLLYTRIGELVLQDPAFGEFAGPYRAQVETLLPKIQSLEGRIETLGEQEDPNVFAWIGKGAQSMVLRSFLGRNKNNLQRIFNAAGEKFVQNAPKEAIDNVSVLDVLGEINGSRGTQAGVQTEIALLKEERRRITASFAPDGGVSRKIPALERHIAETREKLRALFLHYGRLVSESPEQPEYAAVLENADYQLLDRAAALKSEAAENDRRAERLRASLAIDEEKAKISKMERSIIFHRRRIAESEENIRELDGNILEANKRIEDLSKALEQPAAD